MKKVQKTLATLTASSVFSSCKSKECIDDPAFALVGNMDLIVFQNLFGFAQFPSVGFYDMSILLFELQC